MSGGLLGLDVVDLEDLGEADCGDVPEEAPVGFRAGL